MTGWLTEPHIRHNNTIQTPPVCVSFIFFLTNRNTGDLLQAFFRNFISKNSLEIDQLFDLLLLTLLLRIIFAS